MDSIPVSRAGARLTIDLDALCDNWLFLKRLSGDAECAAVVKADAYGCGIEPTVSALSQAGCRTFFAATPDECGRVRKSAPNARIFCLNGLFEDAEDYFLEHDILPVLNAPEDAKTYAQFAKKSGLALGCAIHLDSGMNRLGFGFDELRTFLDESEFVKCLSIELFMTHYACADEIGHPKTERQRSLFLEAAELLPKVPLSAANSAAILQEANHAFDLTRPGIALYGGEALSGKPNPMKPVVALEGRIIQIRTAAKGSGIGYGEKEILERESRIAYVSLGYADGFPRSASHKGVSIRDIAEPATAFFKGRALKGIGLVSMDMMGFDITDISEDEIGVGDFIEVIGANASIDDLARSAGTIGYELLTRLGGGRCARVYKGAGSPMNENERE